MKLRFAAIVALATLPAAAVAVAACSSDEERPSSPEADADTDFDASRSPDVGGPSDGGAPDVAPVDVPPAPVNCSVAPCVLELASAGNSTCARFSDGTGSAAGAATTSDNLAEGRSMEAKIPCRRRSSISPGATEVIRWLHGDRVMLSRATQGAGATIDRDSWEASTRMDRPSLRFHVPSAHFRKPAACSWGTASRAPRSWTAMRCAGEKIPSAGSPVCRRCR